jgi:hypothetical protein
MTFISPLSRPSTKPAVRTLAAPPFVCEDRSLPHAVLVRSVPPPPSRSALSLACQDAISFQSVNYPDHYLAPVSGEESGRLGIIVSPDANAASFQVCEGGRRKGFLWPSASHAASGIPFPS